MAAPSTFSVSGETRTSFHESWNWRIVRSLHRRSNKNKTKRPTPTNLATVTANVWNTVWKVSCKTLSKRLVGMEKSGPFYLQPIVNPLINISYKKTPMGVNTINSMMKDLISNSCLQNCEKHLANRSARKTILKKLKQQQASKSEIISITGNNRETGLAAYDSGDQVQQKQPSHFIDNHQLTASRNKYSISPAYRKSWTLDS